MLFLTDHAKAMRTNLSLAIFLFFLLALFSNLVLGTKESEVQDPELKTCKHQCQQQRQFTETGKRICMQSCDMYHRIKQEREKQIEEETRRKKEREAEDKGNPHQHEEEEESREGKEQEEEEEEEEEESPYVFEQEKDFDTRVETDDGRIRVLQKFSKKSKLLQGIENFRLAILEVRAHTFVSPRHFDSEVVLFNMKGQAILGRVMEEGETEKMNLEPGDMITIPAGTPLYIVNRDENEKLFLAMLHIPVSTPGKFEEFFGPGGRDPESVLSAFSWNVLQAALQSPKEKLERLFSQQNEGSIFEISREQVRALAPKKSGGFWPFSGPPKAPFNLYTKRPSVSNGYGRLTEVGPDDEKSGLEQLNIMLTFANITQRSISTIHYNSHATKIALVIDGKGHFQMACPHVSRSHSKNQKSGPSYHRISANLKPGMVFVVPPGHPFVTLASRTDNLLIFCFEVNARGNNKFTLAGKDNIVTSLDKNAKELAFNYPAEMVNDIFDRKEKFFFPFELKREERGRADA